MTLVPQDMPNFQTPATSWPGSWLSGSPGVSPFDAEWVETRRRQIQELVIREVVRALRSVLNLNSPAYDQLEDWALQLTTRFSSLADLFDLGSADEFLDSLDLDAIWENLVTNRINQFISSVDQALRDQLTGITNAIPGDVDDWLVGLLTGTSSIPAQNLFGYLPESLHALIPITSIGDFEQNLLTNPLLETADSLAGLTVFTWDPTIRHVAVGGSAKTNGGGLKQLESNPIIPATKDQVISATSWVRWRNIVGTGAAFQLALFRYDANSTFLGEQVLQTITSPVTNSSNAGHSDFMPLTGSYTIPAGDTTTRGVTLVWRQTVNVTAGQTWWHDGKLTKTNNTLLRKLQNITADLGLFDLTKVFNQAPQENVQNLVELFTALLDAFANLDFNTVPAGSLIDILGTALTSIPRVNITGIGGPPDIGASIQQTWNQLIGGLVGTAGTGAGLSDLYNIAQEVSSRATRGMFSFDILGIRNNKSFSDGMLPTSTSSMPLTQVAKGASATTFALTQSTAITLYERVKESAVAGVIRWMGFGVTNVTHFFVNIYKMDQLTEVKTLVHASANIIGDVSASMTTSKYVVPVTIQREPGEVYGYELSIRGIGTYTLVGEPTWIHDDPDVYPRRMSSVRNSGTSAPPSTIAAGATTYSSNIPFIEIGVALAGVEIPHGPETFLFSIPGTTTMPIPSWANIVERVAVGAGGGGRRGGTFNFTGRGGYAGVWATDTLTRGTDFTGSPSISVTVGAGGAGGSASQGDIGGTGGSSITSITGHTVTAVGGNGGDVLEFGGANRQGKSPGDIAYGGVPYVGGVEQWIYGSIGAAPGGGGAGGNDFALGNGGYGADGAVWLRFRQS